MTLNIWIAKLIDFQNSHESSSNDASDDDGDFIAMWAKNRIPVFYIKGLSKQKSIQFFRCSVTVRNRGEMKVFISILLVAFAQQSFAQRSILNVVHRQNDVTRFLCVGSPFSLRHALTTGTCVDGPGVADHLLLQLRTVTISNVNGVEEQVRDCEWWQMIFESEFITELYWLQSQSHAFSHIQLSTRTIWELITSQLSMWVN